VGLGYAPQVDQVYRARGDGVLGHGLDSTSPGNQLGKHRSSR